MEDATLFKARGDITQKALLLVPKGALISLRFERPYSEVSILPFTWDGLWFDSWRRQFAISMAGRVIRLMTYVPIAEGHIDMIRPVVYQTFTRLLVTLTFVLLLREFAATPLPWGCAAAAGVFALLAWIAWLRLDGAKLPAFDHRLFRRRRRLFVLLCLTK